MREINECQKAKKRWEKVFKRKMFKDEFTMFQWGYVYGISDITKKIIIKKV